MTCKSLVPKVILFSQYWIACHHRIHGQTCDEKPTFSFAGGSVGGEEEAVLAFAENLENIL